MAKQISSLSVMLGANVAGYTKAMASASASAASFASRVSSTALKLTGVTGALGALGGVLSSGLLVKQQMEAIDVAGKLADRMGMSTEAIAGLQHAADLSGVSQETLTGSWEKMLKNVGEAATGNKQLAQSFRDIGLDAQRLFGMDAESQFDLISGALDGIQNSSLKAKAAQDVFGKSGQQLLPLMKGGSEAMAAMKSEAKALGLTFSRENAAKVEEANDAITRFKAAVTGAARSVAIMLAPTIRWAADRMTEWTKVVIDGAQKVGVRLRSAITYWGPVIVNWAKAALVNTRLVFTYIVDGIAWVGRNAVKGYEALAGWLPVLDVISKAGWSAFAAIKNSITGVIDALRAGDIALAGEIAFGSLELVWMKTVDAIQARWEDMLLVLTSSVEPIAKRIAQIWNNATDIIATLVVSESPKYQRERMFTAGAEGVRTYLAKKRGVEVAPAQTADDMRLDAVAHLERMRKGFLDQDWLKKNWTNDLADKVNADVRRRQKEIEAAQSKLAQNLKAAGEAAKAYDAGVASMKPPEMTPFTRAGEMMSQLADAAEKTAASLGLIVAGSAEDRQMQAQAAWDARIATDAPQLVVNPRAGEAVRETAKNNGKIDAKMTQIVGKMDSLLGAFKVGQTELKEVTF